MNKDFYSLYIASEKWKTKRQLVLQRDKNLCQTCLNGESLEVHHKTYDRLGDEALDDLITLCHDCHEAITTVIRRRRYSKRTIELIDVDRKTPTLTIKAETNGKANIEIQAHIRVTPDFTQWADSRSSKQIFKIDQTDQQQKRKDGRRF